MTAEKIGKRIVYAGHVQGVGFRATALSLSDRFRVAGWVRNLADGRVELVVEGKPEEAEKFVEAVGAALGPFINGYRVETREREELTGFEIKHSK